MPRAPPGFSLSVLLPVSSSLSSALAIGIVLVFVFVLIHVGVSAHLFIIAHVFVIVLAFVLPPCLPALEGYYYNKKQGIYYLLDNWQIGELWSYRMIAAPVALIRMWTVSRKLSLSDCISIKNCTFTGV